MCFRLQIENTIHQFEVKDPDIPASIEVWVICHEMNVEVITGTYTITTYPDISIQASVDTNHTGKMPNRVLLP
ncbi:MAG: hypothetical protein JWQ38_1756 [Flavipsychrobacter sp.]|nr:hypothetical protein [Flavipsychrobacter sp.]